MVKLIEVHFSQIGRHERNEATPSAEVLKKIANTLAVSADYFMSGDASDLAENSIQDKKLINLFSRITRFRKEDQNVITSLIEAYVFKQELKKQLV
ncbi:MAG: hypothetical protein Kow0075_04640 [Salibacteraceae bacterium]